MTELLHLRRLRPRSDVGEGPEGHRVKEQAAGAVLIPDPTTAGDFCRRFTEADVAALLEAIYAVRPQLWAGHSKDLLGPIAYLDVDGTIAPTDGARKAGRRPVVQGDLGGTGR
jgi:hypothetical protein